MGTLAAVQPDGLVVWTVIVNVLPEGQLPVGMRDEKKPFSRGWQGSSKDDYATVWF